MTTRNKTLLEALDRSQRLALMFFAIQHTVVINTICSVWRQWKATVMATVGKKITLEEIYGNNFEEDVLTCAVSRREKQAVYFYTSG